jgi:hypothetical protein
MQHRMVMACVLRVTPGRSARSGGASQGRLNNLSQSGLNADKQVLFTKSDMGHHMAAICIPSSEFLFELDPQQSKSATEIKRLIKEEQELYVSLLCQHTNLEGKSRISPAFCRDERKLMECCCRYGTLCIFREPALPDFCFIHRV